MTTTNLTAETILDKEFKVDFKGYSPEEVDAFLDLVIKDYQQFEQVITKQKELLQQYEDASASQAKRIFELESKLDSQQGNSVATGNQLDILKRLSRLENAVFGSNK